MNLVTDLAVHDAAEGTITLVANAINVNGLATGADRAYDDALARLDAMVERLAAPAADPVSDVPRRWLEAGATIVGGCCGTGPGHIAALRALVDRARPAREPTGSPR